MLLNIFLMLSKPKLAWYQTVGNMLDNWIIIFSVYTNKNIYNSNNIWEVKTWN